MNKVSYVLIQCLFVTACFSSPVEKPQQEFKKGSSVLNPTGSSDSSTESIKKRKEQEYLHLLSELEKKNASFDAQQVIGRGNYYVLGYQSGRGQFSIPSIDPQINRCPIQQIDGIGDTIYGNNHLKYRVAVKEYAATFNQKMMKYCQ